MKTSVREPFKGEDGKYQIRIESYDPARNTMKAIWLVSRNQRLLSQLLDKCEVSNSETSNEALRGNLLSVQRELQELRDVMDRHDGTQTPVLDTSALGLGSGIEECEASLLNSWGESSLASASVATESDIQSERASSAFGFGFGTRRRSVLSLIPKYPRPSIRTDFCVSKFEPFPEIRAKPSKIPKCPKKPKKKGLKSAKAPPRPKTSLSGRGSRLSSYSGYPPSGRTSILKTSSLNVRPATSMALTRPVTKKVSFGEPVVEPRKTCHSKTASLDRKKKKITPKKPIDVRPATSTGVRSIPRASSRNSSLGIDSARSHAGKKPSTSIEAPARMRRTPSRASSRSNNELYLSKDKTVTKTKKAESQSESAKKKSAAKTPVAKTLAAKRPASAKSHVVKTVKTVRSTGKSASKGSAKRLPLRPKSAVEMRSGAPPSVLPFESPPPVPKIHSQPCSLSDLTFPDTSRERSSSPLIRSISIIDDDLENNDPFSSAKTMLPRIRIGEGEQPEYKVQAYFLDEMDDNQSAPQLNSGVIPSSPVEVDSNSGRDSEPPVQSHSLETAASINNEPPSVCPESKQDVSVECNKSEGMDEIKNRMPEKESLVYEKDTASVEASSRDHHNDMSFLPEIGMDYLPEFESEVNGLLDTLMSQDLLTSSFSQDFRLFSTESNFMDTLVDSTEASQPPRMERQEGMERTRGSVDEAENSKGSVKPMIAHAKLDEASISRRMEPQVSAVNATNKDPHSKSSVVSVRTSIPENMVMREETENNGLESSIQDRAKNRIQDSDLDFICGSDEDDSPFSIHARGMPCPVKHEISAVDEVRPHKMPIGDALRRKSTGSYDATALSMSIAAALKPRRYRRSVSQTELDAMLTNNDGYDPCAASPGNSRRGTHKEWTGTGVVSTVDLSSFAETCSVLSSSELTEPDPSETYHDVHHGYSPSFATTPADTYGSFRKSLHRSKSMLPTLEWCFFNPVGSNSLLSPTVRQASLHRASFDFLSGNRTTLMENQSDMCKFHQPSSPLRYDTHSTVPIMSTSGAEDLDEIEESSSPESHPTASKERFMQNSSSYSPWDENHTKENNRRAAHISEDESVGEDSRIPATVTQETDEDTVEDAQGGSSDGSMDCTNRMEKTENRIQSVRPPSRVYKDSVDMSSQKKKWTKSCGFLRFLTCSTTIEKADRA